MERERFEEDLAGESVPLEKKMPEAYFHSTSHSGISFVVSRDPGRLVHISSS